MNSEEKEELLESIQYNLKNTLENIESLFYHDYSFDDYLLKEIYSNYEDVIDYEEFTNYYNEIIDSIFLDNNIIKRSYQYSDHRFDHNNDNHSQINYLKNVPQPAQKTEEWYEFRKKHLTGSNIWKVFSSESTRNQLIYEKLQPTDTTKTYHSLANNPLNWGHKYEPLSCLFYEYFNDVSVEEFGCIPHSSIPFLAASPDGIVTSDKNNGRMVEIKNVVSRDITKIPKMEYYIQMQLQMEVCNLNDCDFVETKFIEYENELEFRKDKYNLKKGMIVVFVKDNSYYIYEYAPLFKNSEKDLNNFIESVYEKYEITNPQIPKNGIRWFCNIYWKLDTYSCVYVPRNKDWFQQALPKIQELWNIIENETNVTDSYLKYKPKSSKKQQTNHTNDDILIQL